MKLKSLKHILSKATSSIKNFKKTKPQLFWITSVCLTLSLLLTIAVLIKLSVFKNKQVSDTKITTNQSPTVDINQPRITGAWEVNPDEPVSPIITKAPVVIKAFNASKVSWLDTPQKIETPDILISKTDILGSNYKISQAFFNIIGNLLDGSQLINAFIEETEEPEGYINNISVLRIIKTSDGQFTLIYPENEKNNGLYYRDRYFSNKVAISFGSYPELNPPEMLSLNGVNLSKNWCKPSNFNTLNNPEFFGSTNNGDFYTINEKSNIDGVVSRELFYLKLKDGTYCIYSQKYDFITDDQRPSINWNNNSTNNDQFNNDLIRSAGCGSAGSKNSGTEIIKKDSSLLQNKVAVATYNQTTFYQIKDINSPIVKYLYQEYKTRFESSTPPELTIEEFAQVKNHFLYQDGTGDWVIFTNTKYVTMAECGKPVIYLYPQQETQVKVQVGAKITQSEPVYPENGWLVTAKPNGELTYQNQSYPYLFWEGLGNGIYPDYRDQGTLVSQKDLVPTLYKQLSRLGLNQKESADFMEFWQPKLPKTPYVRLTWLNTKDMDILAPLNVSPKPDTRIRIFLEFEGLDQPITLKPQKLTAPKRNGFTLVEWGGLLLKVRK